MSQSSMINNSIFLMLDKESVKVLGYHYYLISKVLNPFVVGDYYPPDHP